MQLTQRQIELRDIIKVEAQRIDAAVAVQFKDAMRTAVAEGTGPVVLDLSEVEFIDSSGLGAIVASMKAMPEGRVLELAGLLPAVDKVFRMTRMDRIFTLHASVEDACS